MYITLRSWTNAKLYISKVLQSSSRSFNIFYVHSKRKALELQHGPVKDASKVVTFISLGGIVNLHQNSSFFQPFFSTIIYYNPFDYCNRGPAAEGNGLGCSCWQDDHPGEGLDQLWDGVECGLNLGLRVLQEMVRHDIKTEGAEKRPVVRGD